MICYRNERSNKQMAMMPPLVSALRSTMAAAFAAYAQCRRRHGYQTARSVGTWVGRASSSIQRGRQEPSRLSLLPPALRLRRTRPQNHNEPTERRAERHAYAGARGAAPPLAACSVRRNNTLCRRRRHAVVMPGARRTKARRRVGGRRAEW